MLLALLLVPLLIFVNTATADTECPTVPTISEDRRPSKDRLRLVQYNTEWLFVDEYSAFGCPGDNCTWKNTSEAIKHLGYVADVIRELNPDILNICEIEGCDELNMLLFELDDNTYNPYLRKGTDTSTGQNVGMLTRIDPLVNLYRTEDRYTYPVPGSKCNYNGTSSTTGVSKHYITEFEFNNVRVAMIGAHLLANPTDPMRCAEREAQAMVLQSVVDEKISAGMEVILLGDFNDFDGEVLDLNDNIPTSRVLEILKSGGNLHTVSDQIPKSERFSDWWDPNGDCVAEQSEYSMIDYVLVTEWIREHILQVFVWHGYDEYCGKYNSDHFPLVVDLMF